MNICPTNKVPCFNNQIQQPKCSLHTISLALGIILVLGGLFLTLAGPNVIKLGLADRVIAYITLGSGAIIAAVSTILLIKDLKIFSCPNVPDFTKASHAITIPTGGFEANPNLYVDIDSTTAAHNEQVIQRIKEAQEQGLRTALFVGRRNDQSLPQEAGKIWFSSDIMRHSQKDASHHLQIDFNEHEIPCLFNEVLVDGAVVKFMKSPWNGMLSTPLVKDSSSKLTVECGINIMGLSGPWDHHPTTYPPNGYLINLQSTSAQIDYCKRKDWDKKDFNRWKESVGEEEFQKRFSEFQKTFKGELKRAGSQFQSDILKEENIGFSAHCNKELIEKVKEILLQKFTNVTIEKGPYPPLGESVETSQYLVCTGLL